MVADAPIYVIDDDPNVLESLCLLIKTRGYDALCFPTAELFLEAANCDTVGCVVTDLKMPGIDGGELQRRMLAAESSLGVVIVTGHADVPTTVELMSNGAVTVLEKPYQANVLLAAVDEALDRSRVAFQNVQVRRGVRLRLGKLSDEEKEVMHGMIAGTPIKAIARRMGISMRTVDRRRQSVLQTMQVGSVGELGAMIAKLRLQRSETPPAG